MAAQLLTPTLAPAPIAQKPTSIVRVLVSLRYRIMWNALRRNTWQLVGAIIGALYGLGVLGMALVGLTALGLSNSPFTGIVLILVGSLIVLGWGIMPLVTAGADRTLDPARFAVFPISPGTLRRATLLAGAVGIPGIITGVVAALTGLAWIHHPLSAIIAVLCAPLVLLTCLLFSQLVMTLATRLAASRRYREIIGSLMLVLVILLGPLIAGLSNGVSLSLDVIPQAAEIASWTPFGAAWAIPALVAEGDALGAILRLVIALASVALLAWLWGIAYDAAANAAKSPAAASGKVRDARGPFRFYPASAAGAIAARCLIYWFRDPRYARSLLIVPIMPFLFWFVTRQFEAGPELMAFAVPFMLLFTATATFVDIAFDGTAFAAHVSHGVRGIDDRRGRAWAFLTLITPLTIVVAIVVAVVSGTAHLLPAVLGVGIGMLLAGNGIASVQSAFFLMPVPDPEDSPWASKPGSGALSMAGTFGSMGVLLVLSAPALVLLGFAVGTGSTLLTWLTLPVGLGIGALFYWIGVRWGGRILDRTAPDLLARLAKHA
ncbi:transporter [Mycetocola tolaasinivorans]|uniref:Transporter n=1 Tax=Mycetocola tolaasinivorans TaxID=76635 RepID=A0A3L7A4H5_9MICO|nr:transporter [Mycetocola tolaasinivorans]RLP74760.1 transporter [Mycetocola tolaasinivorans]